ncbi:Glycosidase [Vibrio xiamenensis]|uniref:Glycosidase n=1 Tax=Vibrio xiamenensis TaxID=861298 RepID=A0A1G7XJ43_9VIBR|nr:alpha-amylase family protein [Vibrio xiamenensis]SDG84177.1 Glycosidase [Vibrio xiamenensis]
MAATKHAIYQVFTRLFGNTCCANQAWGTPEQNGVGKFCDFTPQALNAIKRLGATHIWYTGVLHHATLSDYRHIGISCDHPSVVKGRAGSPYAVKDYYSVDPDLATNPVQRNQEFAELIARTHQAGLKVIIDIVPNHVARVYQGLNNPPGVRDFGAGDDLSQEYARDNNFYYLGGQTFTPPQFPTGFEPPSTPLSNTPYYEFPAKWTGNGAAKARPNFDDWYETVKINYGVRPDGRCDFTQLDDTFRVQDCAAHFQFWQTQTVPDSWQKFRDIALYWLAQGVDGFRFDMAEMVPVEFWSYLNSTIKHRHPNTLLIAEIYQPDRYRDYIQLGKMDLLYNKVDLYDLLRDIVQGRDSTRHLGDIEWRQREIAPYLLNFMENHDEQRIASPAFAGDPTLGKPAMLVSCCLSNSSNLVYFGQEVGEPGAEHAGFGQPSRTSIFDYIGVPNHQRWMNNGKFDGEALSQAERELREFYQTLLNLSVSASALQGDYHDLYADNYPQLERLDIQDSLFAFARSSREQVVIVVANFHPSRHVDFALHINSTMLSQWGLGQGTYALSDPLNHTQQQLIVTTQGGDIALSAPPLYCGYLELIKEPL